MPEQRVTIEALVMGSHKITVSGVDEKEAIKNISLFSQIPDACPECGSALFFTYRKVAAKGDKKGGTFYGIKCKGMPAHEKYFHTHDNEAQNLYLIASEGFELEYAARGAQDSGQPERGRQEQPRDDFNARDSRPAQNQQQDNGNGEQHARSGGPTSGQRTLLTNLLTRESVTLNDAYELTRASKKLEEMSVGECARFIDAVKLKLGVK